MPPAQQHTLVDTDIGGTQGYRDFPLNRSTPGATLPDAGANAVCRQACCDDAACVAWIVREIGSESDKNCSAVRGELCCWLKPQTTVAEPGRKGCSSGFVARPLVPPGPPAPRLGGYAAVVNGSTLTVERQAGAAAAPSSVLARFDLSTLENGVVVGAWNMLRLLVQPGGAVTVWFNPMFPETGFQGTADDHARLPKPLPPRIAVVDADPLPHAAASYLAMAAGVSQVRVDYVSALPGTVV